MKKIFEILNFTKDRLCLLFNKFLYIYELFNGNFKEYWLNYWLLINLQN